MVDKTPQPCMIGDLFMRGQRDSRQPNQSYFEYSSYCLEPIGTRGWISICFWAQNTPFYSVVITLISWVVFQIGPRNPRDSDDCQLASFNQFTDLLGGLLGIVIYLNTEFPTSEGKCTIREYEGTSSRACSDIWLPSLLSLPPCIPMFLSISLCHLRNPSYI